jgi:hypothetical protein
METKKELMRLDSSGTAKVRLHNAIPVCAPDDPNAGRSSGLGRRQGPRGGKWLSGLLLTGLLTLVVFAVPSTSRAASIGVGVSVGIAPPPLPVYAQPVCPGPGYIWTPGYWAYNPVDGYYWVPGIWVMAPEVGFLWTPGYWGWGGAAFFWHAGYWGPQVGFYGGINYGFGYTGVGYAGGYWRGGTFFYNRSVNNFGGRRFANVYDRPLANNFRGSRVSYNGGAGGVRARPTSAELAAEHQRHIVATSAQETHMAAARNANAGRARNMASNNRELRSPKPKPTRETARNQEVRTPKVKNTKETVSNSHELRSPKPSHKKETASNNRELRSPKSKHTSSKSRAYSADRGGGSTHEQMTAHQSNHSSHNGFNTREEAKATSKSHSASAPRYQASRGAAPSRHAPARSETQHSSRPSGGGTERTAWKVIEPPDAAYPAHPWPREMG